LVATDYPDTTLIIVPAESGPYTYRVRGVDAEGDRGGWSNAVTLDVDLATSLDIPWPPVSRLERIHPNPFNPTTSIPFSVASVGGANGPLPVRLAIYTAAGRLVTILVDEPLGPGAHERQWQAIDRKGHSLPSGVYIARLDVGDQPPSTRKLVLVK
jgi:hypothetical protein